MLKLFENMNLIEFFALLVGPKRKISVLNSTFNGSSNQATPQKTKTLLWGATGEQEWEPAIVTGKHKCSN